MLDRENLERRALGRTDYPTEYPLKEVYLMARHCSGAVILGFSQSIAERVTVKPNTANEKKIDNMKMLMPWDHLEAGILFSLRIPLMVFREDGISGGVFDDGVTDVFINKLPIGIRQGLGKENRCRYSNLGGARQRTLSIVELKDHHRRKSTLMWIYGCMS